MATVPPIQVGSLTDVPAPGSQISATFHQEVANRVVQRFTNKAALDAWTAEAGTVAIALDTGILYRRMAAGWAQITPWVGSVPDGAHVNPSDVNGVNLMTVNVPADPGVRVANVSTSVLIEVTPAPSGTSPVDRFANLIVYIDGTAVASGRADVREVTNRLDAGSWAGRFVTVTASAVLAVNRVISVSVYLAAGGPYIARNPSGTTTRLDVLVVPKGF
jgi:hypothetical protein